MEKSFNEIFKKALEDSMSGFVSAERAIVKLYISAFVSATSRSPSESQIFSSLRGNISRKIIKDVLNSMNASGELVESSDGTATVRAIPVRLEGLSKATETRAASVAAPGASEPIATPLPPPSATPPDTLQDTDIKLWSRFLTRQIVTSIIEQYKSRGIKIPTTFSGYDERKRASWNLEFERMMRIDKRTPKEISDLMNLVYADNFWSFNVLSPQTLREKFDRLMLQLKAKHANKFIKPKQSYEDPEALARERGLK